MAQTQQYVFAYKFLLSAIYDAVDNMGAQLIEGNSKLGVLRIRMPENYGDLLVKVAPVREDCEITLAADTSTSQEVKSTQENDAAQCFFSALDAFLSSYKET